MCTRTCTHARKPGLLEYVVRTNKFMEEGRQPAWVIFESAGADPPLVVADRETRVLRVSMGGVHVLLLLEDQQTPSATRNYHSLLTRAAHTNQIKGMQKATCNMMGGEGRGLV